MPLIRHSTVRRRWQTDRDLVIIAASQKGVSQSRIANAFDLTRARVGAIVRDARARDAQISARLSGGGENPYPVRAWPLPSRRGPEK